MQAKKLKPTQEQTKCKFVKNGNSCPCCPLATETGTIFCFNLQHFKTFHEFCFVYFFSKTELSHRYLRNIDQACLD